ncbi:hypothetical protein [Atopomonas sediminilitoris]|uniref:hypothetical protein n=1 Tax=Atopomonas sediminilitoris TaxID=2919919 RepID=UPI001F4D8A4F|nr:hypothetical protein [Atopomonas sediminilitoris]MCJ8168248.1 hypothetical protein [Atopomonas sediminilitoris]
MRQWLTQALSLSVLVTIAGCAQQPISQGTPYSGTQPAASVAGVAKVPVEPQRCADEVDCQLKRLRTVVFLGDVARAGGPRLVRQGEGMVTPAGGMVDGWPQLRVDFPRDVQGEFVLHAECPGEHCRFDAATLQRVYRSHLAGQPQRLKEVACKAPGAQHRLIGRWYEERELDGKQVKQLLALNTDGRFQLDYQVHSEDAVDVGQEIGCWSQQGDAQVLETTEVSGRPVYYRDSYRLREQRGDRLVLEKADGSLSSARRVHAGFQLQEPEGPVVNF